MVCFLQEPIMNEPEFIKYLKRGGRSDSVIERCIRQHAAFQAYLDQAYPGTRVQESTSEMLEDYVAWVESEPKTSAKNPLWALRYYFDFIDAKEMKSLAGELRQERIQRKPFQLKKFRGVNPEYAEKLASNGIDNVKQMLAAGKTPEQRAALSERLGIPPQAILEFVKLSDLARIGAVRRVRARLYHDAGLTPESIATWEPDDLRAMLASWVAETGFVGIAPLPKEVQNLVKEARRLPKVVQY
jgi:hypothetical protein